MYLATNGGWRLCPPAYQLGIDVIGDASWGTHFCLFYHTKEDLVDILVPYFKAGLKNNEFCMWATSEPLNVKDAKRVLRGAVRNLDDYIERGQIEILDYSQWYTRSGAFAADKVLRGWLGKKAHGVERGFDGLRLTANTFWLKEGNWKAFPDYEATVDGVIKQYRTLAVCTYSLDRCGAAEVIDVASNHQFALIKCKGEWKLIESSERRKTKDNLHLHGEIMKNMAEGVILTRVSDAVIVYTNPKFDEMFGYGPGELLGRNISVVNAPTDKSPEKVVEEIQKCLRERGVWQGEVYNIKKDGTPFWCYANVSTFNYSLYGEVWVAVHADITKHKKLEEKIMKSKEFTMNIFDCMHDAVLVVNVHDFSLASINMVFADWAGMEIKEIIGRPCYEIIYKKTNPCYDYCCPVKEILEKGKASLIEHIQYKNGDKRFYEISASPIRDDEGKVVQIICVRKDITERKVMEKEIERVRHRNELILQSSGEGIFGLDLEGKHTFVNPAAARMLGYEVEELTGKHSHTTWHHSRPDGTLYPEEECPIYATYKHGKVHIADNEVFWRKDGSSFPVRYTSTPIREGWKLLGAVVSFRDITERKKIELELEASRESFLSIVEKSTDGIIIVDNEGIVRFVNPSGEKIFNQSAENAIGMPFGFPVVIDEFIERDILRLDGSIAIVEMRSVETNWKGENAYLISLRDITMRKRYEESLLRTTEELKKIDQMKSDFISIASHELRTPLTSIKNAVDIILSRKAGEITDPQEKFLSMAKRNINRLGSLINDILNISKIESGKIELNYTEVDIKNIIENVFNTFRTVADSKSISLKMNIAPDLPVIYADGSRIEEVLINLISNAIKFTHDKGIVTINAQQVEGVPYRPENIKGFLEISVTDTGIGIPKKSMEHLFEKFYQVDSSLSEKKKRGTGLGLAISKGTIEAHGGKIQCKSKEGEGSTFSFTLPI